MISTLISTTVHRPVAVLMITIMVAVAGLGALFLPIVFIRRYPCRN